MSKRYERREEPPLTYGGLFSMFVQRHPEIAVYDYRPAGEYALMVWEQETHNVYIVRYQPDSDRFTIEAQ